jgi:hypothetical protein
VSSIIGHRMSIVNGALAAENKRLGSIEAGRLVEETLDLEIVCKNRRLRKVISGRALARRVRCSDVVYHPWVNWVR